MCSGSSRITPFMKQCYVTFGVSLNMCSHGFVSGYSAVLLPQLRKPDSSIQVDETSESWIASVFGITFVIGNLINPIVMDKCGRKKTNLITIIIMAVGWYMIVWSPNIPWLITARIIKGFALGFTSQLCPVMIGEYTSPKNRGGFLATISLAISCGVLATHTIGLFLHWKTTALICAVIMTVDFFIVIFTPETPSWLIKKGRYDECKKAFRWLRGFNEEEELKKMIEANIDMAKSKDKKDYKTVNQRTKTKFEYLRQTARKNEFYKPILIVIHLYTLGQWGGSNILSQYSPDIFFYVVGDSLDPGIMTVVLTIHRVISGIYMAFIIAKFKRRILLISLTLINVLSLLAIALYSYARSRDILPVEYPAVAVVLIHIQMFSSCSGGVTLGFIIAGELFPLEYKSLAGGLSTIFMSANLFIVSKTMLYFITRIGIEGAYCIYAGVSIYCLVIVCIFLPETKDKTLQDIEDGFRQRMPLEEVPATELLTSH